VLLVTSAGGGDGKTTTALNLSIALSELQEERVLLIDGDLRRPSVQEYLRAALEGEFDPAPEGFIDLLDHPNGRVSEHVSKVGKLYVMAGDGETADSLDALITSSPRSAMARLRKHFKYIVIDSPPILFMVDSHLLADIADRVTLVVRARHTPREAFLRALESFDSSNLLGVIVNDVAHDQDGYRSASYYYQKRYLSAAKRSRTSIRARESA
jgi:Mrp family chromosome partitioning ATPase